MPTPPRIAIRRLAAARVISVTGSEAVWIALMVAIYASTHSTVWMSAALFVTIGASGIATPLLGSLGDRLDRRRVMIASELCAAAVAGVTVAFTHRPLALIALALAGAVAQSPFFSASTAAVPNLVEPADVAWANSTISIGRNAGALLGPMLGGAISGLLEPSVVFAASAVCFAGSAATIAGVSGTFADPDRTGADEHRGLRAGVRLVVADPVLRLITLAWIVLLFLLGPIIVAELPLARSFGAGAVGYGFLAACWGGGAIGGSFLGRRLAATRERATMIGGCAVIGIGFAVVAFAPLFAVALAGMVTAGMAEGAVTVSEQGILQRRTPDAVRSRATAATEAAVLAAFALSFPLAGFLIHVLGVRGVYLLAALGCSLSALILIPAMRELEPLDGLGELPDVQARGNVESII
ncbi:MAG TPA: MFS transporter [Gaiellales bacterium]|jgi:MFS family permease